MIVEFWVHCQLGAFLAGALLAETNFRTQIEADIRPFRGLLLGLFFITTGTSIDLQVVPCFNLIRRTLIMVHHSYLFLGYRCTRKTLVHSAIA